MQTKKYTNNDITVVWEPSKCIHSAICFKGLPQVFDPRKKPWISIENSETDTIIKQVNQCPSGALSLLHNQETKAQSQEQNELLKVKVTPAGPLLIHGNFILEQGTNETVLNAQTTALCRCGQSMNKPFCDGSHKKINFDQ
jgi:uncharacterized Fe-S cluster protein YjdI